MDALSKVLPYLLYRKTKNCSKSSQVRSCNEFGIFAWKWTLHLSKLKLDYTSNKLLSIIQSWRRKIVQIKPPCSDDSHFEMHSALQHVKNTEHRKDTEQGFMKVNNMWWPGQRLHQRNCKPPIYERFPLYVDEHDSSHMTRQTHKGPTELNGVIESTDVGQSFMRRKTTVYLYKQAYISSREDNCHSSNNLRPQLWMEFCWLWELTEVALNSVEQPFKTPSVDWVTGCCSVPPPKPRYLPRSLLRLINSFLSASSIPACLAVFTLPVQSGTFLRYIAFYLSVLNSPLCQSVCVVPVWPWQNCPCRWFWAGGSFRCVAAHLSTRRWSYDIGHQASGSTSLYPSLSGWPTGRYAVERERNRWTTRITKQCVWHSDYRHFPNNTLQCFLVGLCKMTNLLIKMTNL